MNDQLYRKYSRFLSCSVKNCPLDEEYPNRPTDPADKEPVCTMAKANRMRIAATDPDRLPMRGMKSREWAGFKRFEALPIAVRNQMVEAGRTRLAAARKGKTAKSEQLEGAI